MVTDHCPSNLFTIQLGPYIYLAQNCIRLEPDPLRAHPLDYLSQILRPFTTPMRGIINLASFFKGMVWVLVKI